MKKFKIILILIILSLLGLIVYQNQDYFMAKQGFDINIYFSDYSIPEASNGLFWLGCFASGFLISYFSSLFFRFKAQKKIKLQNQTIENYRETVQELKKEIDNIKASGYFNRDNRPQESIEENEEEDVIIVPSQVNSPEGA